MNDPSDPLVPPGSSADRPTPEHAPALDDPSATDGGPSDPAQVAQLARAWRDLAGRLGLPEIIESAAGVLPGATTSHVVYDLGVAVSLALGDVAEAVDSYVDGPRTLPVVGPSPSPTAVTGLPGSGPAVQAGGGHGD